MLQTSLAAYNFETKLCPAVFRELFWAMVKLMEDDVGCFAQVDQIEERSSMVKAISKAPPC